MILSSSNIISSGVLSTPSGGEIDNIISNLGGSVWNPDGIQPVFGWNGSASQVTYIAGVGIGFSKVIIRIENGPTREIQLNKNGGFFAHYDSPQDFTGLTVEFFGAGVLVNFAMGTSFSVPNGGEQAGYLRTPLGDTRVYNSSVDRAAIPVAQSVVRKPQQNKLRVDNMPRVFAESTWYDFTKYILEEGFFYVLEKESDENFAYMAYEPAPSTPKAHSSTRELVRAEVSFKSYVGG